jgi:hypothetical protein
MAERFPAEVAEVLREAGWTGRRITDEQILETVEFVCGGFGRNGETIEAFPAAIDALTEFGGLYVVQSGAGRDLHRRSFAIDPIQVAATAETLADLSRMLGIKLFPIGMEGDHESVLAVDEAGRVWALDHAGVWHLGDSVAGAITTLVLGLQPHRLEEHRTG